MDAGIIIMAPALVFVVCRVLESCCADKNTEDAAGGRSLLISFLHVSRSPESDFG